jgi:Holliday junction resolvase
MKTTEFQTRSKLLATLNELGFSSLGFSKQTANGPDLFVTKGIKAFSVEIKSTRKTERGSIQVSPVEKNRRGDDLIAITFPSGYVLVEPMADHLKACTSKGYRTLTILG